MKMHGLALASNFDLFQLSVEEKHKQPKTLK
jgi:hypothetical protein